MVNESEFHDNNSQWEAFEKDKDAYLKWLETTIEKAEPIEKRSHGFRYRGQYQEAGPRGPGNRKERLMARRQGRPSPERQGD